MEPADTQTEHGEMLVPIREYASLPEASEHTLVVLAMNLSCWVMPGPSGYVLCVEPAYRELIAGELRAYDAEQRAPQREVEVPWFDGSFTPALLWAVIVMITYSLQLYFPGLTASGENSRAGLLLHHEWWRPFTSLFLHGDFHHLLGNLVAGLAFFTLAFRSFGTLRGVWLTTLAGVLGNTITALLHPEPQFVSVGASTAVFGALGLLTGLGIHFAWLGHRYRRPLYAPLGGGVILLAWLGAGGPNVDILGHLCGFLTGLVLGLLAANPQIQQPPRPPAAPPT